MARQISGGLVQPSVNVIAAHNEVHRSVVALESAKPHYDGPEWSNSGVEQVTASFYNAPTTLAEAIDTLNRIKGLYNDHIGRGNAGSGKKIYAHKTADSTNTISTADMASGSSYEATILAALITLVTELRSDYEAHRTNSGGTWHTSVDGTNVLGGQPTISSFAEVASELNLLKAMYQAHRVLTSGSVHANADSTNTISSANATSTDIDSMITLANELKADFNAHLTQATIHSQSDSVNSTSAADVGYPGGLFTLANEIRGDYELHRASTSYHEAADAANTISSSAASTIAGLIALAVELRTDIDAHMRNAPVSGAMRGV